MAENTAAHSAFKHPSMHSHILASPAALFNMVNTHYAHSPTVKVFNNNASTGPYQTPVAQIFNYMKNSQQSKQRDTPHVNAPSVRQITTESINNLNNGQENVESPDVQDCCDQKNKEQTVKDSYDEKKNQEMQDCNDERAQKQTVQNLTPKQTRKRSKESVKMTQSKPEKPAERYSLPLPLKVIAESRQQDSITNCSLEMLPQTRSGRRIVPPLDYWRNERLQVSVNTSCDSDTTLMTGTPDYISAFTMTMRQRTNRTVVKRKAKPLKSVPASSAEKKKAEKKKAEKKKAEKKKADTKRNSTECCKDKAVAEDQCVKSNKRKQRVRKKAEMQRSRACSEEENMQRKLPKELAEERKPQERSDRKKVDNKRNKKILSLKEFSTETETTTTAKPGEQIWSKQEVSAFFKAIRGIQANAPSFWHLVSAYVSTRTEEECIEFHQQQLPSTRKKKKTKKKKDTVKSPSQITGGKKTLKRKRQLKELLVNYDDGYDDDFFNSSQYRNMKSAKKPRVAASENSDDDSFGEFYGDQGQFETPVNVRGPDSGMRQLSMSEKKTPAQSGGVFSPAAVVMSNEGDLAERYMHRLKNVRRDAWKRRQQREEEEEEDHARVLLQPGPSMPTLEPVYNIFAMHKDTHDDDENEEEDFYFSDD